MTSHRQVFRSSAIIGGASVINMVISIVKVKVLAVLLGPAGIGLMGLYQNIMGMASTLAGCGMGSSGVRQLAASADEAETLSIVRRALWLGNLMLGIAGMAILWLLREPVAHWVFGDSAHASEVGWLGVGLLLTLIAGSQTALLQGLRRIDDLARVSIISALVAASVGILAIYLLGKDGVLWFVLTAPAATVLVASYYAARLPQPQTPYDLATIQQQWLAMLKLGIPLMAASLLMLTTQLAVRSIVLREFGLEASGYFQAAWAISVTYVGLVLNALVMDYFPRLTTVISDHEQAKNLVNEQAEMVLLIAGPVLMAMITLAPWVIHLLYAQSFSPAAEILRWQVLGDLLKVASVPAAFIFVATGHGSVAIGIQVLWSAAYLGAFSLGIREIWPGYGGRWLRGCLSDLLRCRCDRCKQTNRIQTNSAELVFYSTTLACRDYHYVPCSPVGRWQVTLWGHWRRCLVSVYSLRRLDHLIDLTGWLRQKFL